MVRFDERGAPKKLVAAARHWAAGGAADDGSAAEADLVAFGLDAEAPAPEVCEIWEENWSVLELFCACSTQWRVAPMGGLIGLDYAGVEAAMRMRRLPEPDWPELLADLQVMEREALAVFGEKAARARGHGV
mgnify:CR=1 FL=1